MIRKFILPAILFVTLLCWTSNYSPGFEKNEKLEDFKHSQLSEHSRKNEEFIQESCRVESYERILKPCFKRLSKKISFEKNANDYITKGNLSQVEIKISKDDNKLSTVFIKTYNFKNEPKTIGGDSWIGYLKEHDTRIAAFHFTDLIDGTYVGYFDILTPGNYTLQLVLEHTFCNGLADPPDYWFAKGDSHGRYQTYNQSETNRFLNSHLTPIVFQVLKAPIKARVPCSNKEPCIINQKKVFWRNHQFVGYKPTKSGNAPAEVKFRMKKKVKSFMAFGDSLTYWFYGSIKKDCARLFYFCDVTYIWSYKLKKSKPSKPVYNGLDFDEKRFLSEIEDSMSGKSVFLINFGLHHVGNLPLKRCFKLFQGFITLVKRIRAKLLEKAPLVIWKTTTPPFIENRRSMTTNKSYWHTFRTKQRIYAWNKYTIREACKSKIPVLDIYDMALSSPRKTVDGMHFPNSVFWSAKYDLFQYFIKYFERDDEHTS